MFNRRFLFLFALCSLAPPGWAQRPIFGFSESSVTAQREREERTISGINESSLRELLRTLTREPHHAGSSADRRLADYMRQKFADFGFDSKIVEYRVYLPRPTEVRITLLKPERRELAIREKGSYPPEALLPFNAYSPSCDLTADLVYVNYGLAEDFKKLAEFGVRIKGKIALIRYGRIFRGLKVREAQTAGAAGVILYSDPADDGFVRGDVFPKGRMRPWDAPQRGSIRFGEVYPGDPLTPGIPALENAPRIKPSEDPDQPKIPCTPISYGDAQWILRSLRGPAVPREWQGGLPFTYHLGPGPSRVRMVLKMDYRLRPIWNNIAVLKGTEEPGQTVIFGGHRDAWVFGAQDPNSGSAVLLEAARVLGEEYRRGWRPHRTLVFAQWDAEEYSMIGSTEWGEQHAQELSANCVAYVNFDGTISGSLFGTGGVPSLDEFTIDLTRDVIDPSTRKPLFDVWWKSQNLDKSYTGHPLPDNGSLSVGRMGGGSDHVVFLNHLGIPAMGFGFGGANGVYHSTYDNFEWMEKQGDPGFLYHGIAARLTTLGALRLADAEMLPLSFARYADELTKQFTALEKLHGSLLDSAGITFVGLRSLNDRWKEAADELRDLMHARMPAQPVLDSLNRLLNSIERIFVGISGVQGRSWYRHRIVAASGYASIGFPGISAGLDRRDIVRVREEMSILAVMITGAESITRKCTELFREVER